MTRRPTFSELAWPDGPGDADLPVRWARSVTLQVLDWTWRAFDRLRSKHLSRIDVTQPLEQLERDLVRQHFMEIQMLFVAESDGYSTIVPQHEWPEMESRSSAAAKPPAYDLAFVSVANQRWAWPIEAKVIPSPGTWGEYLKDVHGKFVAGIAGPLTGEGGMLGYLLFSDGSAVLRPLEERLGQRMESLTALRGRLHRMSRHSRKNAPELCLHHMLMICVQ